jgi:hypothetical protein
MHDPASTIATQSAKMASPPSSRSTSMSPLERFLTDDPETDGLFLDPLSVERETPQQRTEHRLWRWQAALRLREALCSVPFYANRAAKAKQEGGEEGEMDYWLGLQGSQGSLRRLPKG